MAKDKIDQAYLEYLINSIKTKTEKFYSLSKNWEHFGKSIGDMLTEIKMKLSHGEFMRLCKNN